ncbi:MAG: hypothetical protein ACXVJO_15725 [Thermoanaerobaculia bacterium]
MRIKTVLCTIVAATSLLNCGCNAPATEHDAVAAKAVHSPATEPPFRIVATDAGFEAPDTIDAGLRHVIFENRGTDVHEAMLVRLPPDKSPSDYVAAVKAGADFPEGALDYSGPGLTSPGETVELWLRVDPGRYILICWNNHATTTPVHPFVATDHTVDDAAPKQDVVLRLLDYRFDLEGTLRSGPQVIRVETPGPSMHEADLFLLAKGRTTDDLNRWYKTKNRKAPPGTALGGADDSHDIRRVVWLKQTFVPGRYALHCGMPVTTAAAAHKNTTHADIGMVQEIDVAP